MRWTHVKALRATLLFVFASLYPLAASAQIGVYQTQAEFLEEAFDSAVPKSQHIWVDDKLRPSVTDILGHPPGTLRIRYWQSNQKTAWILQEIGKEKPITFGVVIEDEAISYLRVLQFRESRGWEIRYPFFTQQFSSMRLSEDGSTNQRIDSITGATLSVNAATRIAKLALFLDGYLRQPAEKLTEAR
ncbi:MAG: FMN-binding protein [Gammaproteobacteria bacterium]|nr:FMN-binding protein [Gammaproteobacteria bacterium]